MKSKNPQDQYILEKTVTSSLDIVLSINQLIQVLGEIISSMRAVKDEKVSQELDKTASQVEKLIQRIKISKGEGEMDLPNDSFQQIFEDLESAQLLISEIKESWLKASASRISG